MTHKDIYTKFMIEYDKANVTSSYPSLTEYEVATVLDKAYNALIAQKVTGNNYRRIGLEGDLKAITDLAPLIRTATEKLTSSTDTNVMSCNLPDGTNDSEKFLYFISAQLIKNMGVEAEGELPEDEDGGWSHQGVNIPAGEGSTHFNYVYMVDKPAGNKYVKILYKDPYIRNFCYAKFKSILIPTLSVFYHNTEYGSALSTASVGSQTVYKHTGVWPIALTNADREDIVAGGMALFYLNKTKLTEGLFYTANQLENIYVCLPKDSFENEELGDTDGTEEWYINRNYELFYQNQSFNAFSFGNVYSYNEIENTLFSGYSGDKDDADYSDMIRNFGPTAGTSHIRFAVCSASSSHSFTDDGAYDFVPLTEYITSVSNNLNIETCLFWVGSHDKGCFAAVDTNNLEYQAFIKASLLSAEHNSIELVADIRTKNHVIYEPISTEGKVWRVGTIKDVADVLNVEKADAVGFLPGDDETDMDHKCLMSVDGGITVKYIQSGTRWFYDKFPYDGINPRPVPVKLVNHDTADKFIVTSYNMPWVKIPICYIEDYTMNVVYDPIDKPILDSISITYIKTPHKFVKDISDSTILKMFSSVKTEPSLEYIENYSELNVLGVATWGVGVDTQPTLTDGTEYTLEDLATLGLYQPQTGINLDDYSDGDYIEIMVQDTTNNDSSILGFVVRKSSVSRPSDLVTSYFWYESATKLELTDAALKDYYTFECNDTVAEELISLAVAFALENVESQRLNSKLNMRGLEA